MISFLRKRADHDPFVWYDLARYNDERRHGIVHTAEWVELMAAQKRDYDLWVMRQSGVNAFYLDDQK